ncbi:hypothetical protein BGZ94_001691 [Podila epigama]|nr:hypothetical protein BGZ94_001691 [Podila epigama]
MSTVAERLAEAHETLLKLYTSIPILSPCLEKIKTNHAEFIALNSRLRVLQEIVVTGQYRADKARKQLDSVFTRNKAECERIYHKEISQLKAFEDERRACLRKRDDVVTLKYSLQKERAILLEETRQLKRVNESVFDRSKDTVANADFPEELYWQLELQEYDVKIEAAKRQLLKYNTALSCLARAANLSEAALMAFLGFPDAAYKVWRVEYALKAIQRMRLYLRVELSLRNAYTNEDSAREACPNLIPNLAKPIKISTVQNYFGTSALEPMAKTAFKMKHSNVVEFAGERPFRQYIEHLRAAHKSAELLAAQETERVSAMQAYRESIVPRIARIRRHVFQNSRLGGRSIDGWENEAGEPLLGSEADSLIRGGLQEVEPATAARPGAIGQTLLSSPGTSRNGHTEAQDEVPSSNSPRDRRGSGAIDIDAVPDLEEEQHQRHHEHHQLHQQETTVIHNGRVVLSAGRAPLSTLAPGNMLGSQILMEVDEQRRQFEANNESRARSKSRSRRSSDERPHTPHERHERDALGNMAMDSNTLNVSDSSNANGTTSSNHVAQGERESRKKGRGLFGFSRGRRGSNAGGEDAVVPSTTSNSHRNSIFSLGSRRHRNNADVSSLGFERTTTIDTVPSSRSYQTSRIQEGIQRGHRRNVPSISISHEDGAATTLEEPHSLQRTLAGNASMSHLPSRPRVMSIDEYIESVPVHHADGTLEPHSHHGSSEFDPISGSAPLIPSYEEHGQHQVVHPDAVHNMTNVHSFDGLSSLAENDEDESQSSGTGENMSVSMDEMSISYSPPTVSYTSAASGHSLGGRRAAGGESRIRSRSLSPHPPATHHESIASVHTNGGRSERLHYQYHQQTRSDQPLPMMYAATYGEAPPPDYVMRPPEYSA